MNEYPHIYQEMKNLAFKREERDLEMIRDSLDRVMNLNKDKGTQVDMYMERIQRNFKNSVCTEVDNHEIMPLAEMFEEMKEKLPLEELLDNFEVSNSEDEDDEKDGDDGSHSDSSEVAFSDVNSIGLEKMYNQFQGTAA
jgi:hypothetical protein